MTGGGNIEEILLKVEQIEESLHNITVALLGNEFNKNGIIHTVTEQRLKIELLEAELKRIDLKHEKRFDAVKWVIVGLSLASGFGISELIQFLQK